MDVEDIHPMRKECKIDDILPFLTPFKKCRKKPKPNFEQALRETFMKELKIKIPKSELEL